MWFYRECVPVFVSSSCSKQTDIYSESCVTVWDFFGFDGSIQDIRACQRRKKKRWVPSVFKGQESHAEFPLFTPVVWTQTVFLPGATPKVMGQMERGKGTRLAFTLFIYFLSHSLPFPLLPSTASQAWISGLLCVWSTPFQHNERRVHKNTGNISFPNI